MKFNIGTCSLRGISTQTPRVLAALLITLLLQTPTAATAQAASPADNSAAEQARLYRQTLIAIRKGHRTNTQAGMAALVDYPLYPYLEKALLSRHLRELPKADVDAFLTRYEGTVVARQLRHRWLKTLAHKHQWQDYMRYYHTDIASSDLRCLYLEALYQNGFESLALSQTADLWLSASSLPDSCDPVFERWQQAGLKTDDLVWARMQLAINSNNTLLARYLSKRASAQLKPYTRRLLSVHYSPDRLRKTDDFSEPNRYTADIVSHGLTRLASRDPALSSDLWIYYRGQLALSSEQNAVIRDKIARQLIASGSDNALRWLIAQDPNAEDSYLLEWRIRLALRDQQWHRASQWIALLPEELQQHPRWRYWLGRSLQNSQPDTANAVLESVARERNYYGFLAADLLQKPYDFNHEELNAAAFDELAHIPAIARAKTFYDMHALTAARREWLSALQDLDQQQLVDATGLANHWGWHQQAILTTIRANNWDDLSIRFPLAYQQNMMRSAEQSSIRLEWLYAITRQESAFATDARSSAGARGLMQLTPGTARQVAASLGMKISTRDLYHADTNIQLGSTYLKQLLARFDGNHILATAAYNAGPSKVDQWLKNQGRDLPYDVWIETLPFHETRNYVQSVLAFSVIYSHRLGLNSPMMMPRPQQLTVSMNTVAGENP